MEAEKRLARRLLLVLLAIFAVCFAFTCTDDDDGDGGGDDDSGDDDDDRECRGEFIVFRTEIPWTPVGNANLYGSVVDDDGNLHQATEWLNDQGEQEEYLVYYCACIGDQWEEPELIVTSDRDIGGPYIALDGSGRAHLAFAQKDQGGTDNHVLYYAGRSGDEWNAQEVLTDEGLRDVAFAADTDGNAHFVHYRRDTPQNLLMYTTNASGAWTTEQLDEVLEATCTADLISAPGGTLHAVYLYTNWESHDDDSTDHNRIRYASLASGAWATDTIEQDDETGHWPRIAVGGGKVHTVYHGELSGTDSEIRYAARAQDGWTASSLATGPVDLPMLAAGTNGAAYVVYVEGSYYLRFATDLNGSFQREQIDANSEIGMMAEAVGEDAEGYVHVYYPYYGHDSSIWHAVVDPYCVR